MTEERTNIRGWRRRRNRRKRGEMIRGRRRNRTRKKKEIIMRERTRINSLQFVLLCNPSAGDKHSDTDYGPNSEVLTRMWVELWGHAGKTSCFQNVGQYFNRQCKHFVRKSHCKQTIVTGLQSCCAVLPNICLLLAARHKWKRACAVEIGLYLLCWLCGWPLGFLLRSYVDTFKLL